MRRLRKYISRTPVISSTTCLRGARADSAASICIKAGVQWGRLYFSEANSVLNDHWLVYNNRVPVSVRIFNSPAIQENVAKVTGFFVQDSFSAGKLTLNVGGRWDKYVGTIPDQSTPGGTVLGPALGRRQGSHQPQHRGLARRRRV